MKGTASEEGPPVVARAQIITPQIPAAGALLHCSRVCSAVQCRFEGSCRVQVALEGCLKAQQVRSCCTSALRMNFLPVCRAEPCPCAFIFPVLHFPSTHTSSREMATNCRSCCSGGRDTRTARSWATRPLQWASLTWPRYRVLGTQGTVAWPPHTSAGKGVGLAGRLWVL